MTTYAVVIGGLNETQAEYLMHSMRAQNAALKVHGVPYWPVTIVVKEELDRPEPAGVTKMGSPVGPLTEAQVLDVELHKEAQEALGRWLAHAAAKGANQPTEQEAWEAATGGKPTLDEAADQALEDLRHGPKRTWHPYGDPEGRESCWDKKCNDPCHFR